MARLEMLRLLAESVEWDLIDEIAVRTRGVNTLRRFRAHLGDHPS